MEGRGFSPLSNPNSEKYWLVREDILPEALQRTVQAKQLLLQGEAQTVHQAVNRVGLSRSAFYKYKDGIHEFENFQKERVVTISLDLQHRSGVLSKVLTIIAQFNGNVLTLSQTIPLNGLANVVISLDSTHLSEELSSFIAALRAENGVKKVMIIGQG